ncbi:flavodoxin domain-containing protein [Streptomyces acidiscabies]|uniref:Flavodoxin domain-containing protein n=2 Tax=Streptomyces acidiscabies TaxID=42234 RepID=A0AAP6BBL8_9ACTN|nr:flavodoxin domain-containing protein [Streptomyces acidiscabies]MBP5942452.1 flavodoxin [Streptomyces sp. LBUM 1476]MBZ3917801.1 flavodoxin [Streptomyces acidiscabies]MDX2961771.1 flavodoxin domain-containing protein [Streptomyces acidiscabies]MDX3023482.1 flavodoxin domain-containing protein [Streptomyces acidiscabies]MDX3789312.1 flavodoxin domain-containing protein [Streptomyces acidiscabies]
MAMTVLVAYGTTNGSTARIAEAVAVTLRERGLDTETRPAGSVTDVTRYEAVVVGGALYMGRWHRDARRFVRRNRRALAGRPLWLFSSGPLDASASERDIPPIRGVQRTMTSLDARGHVTFGGCLEEGTRGWIAGRILSADKGGDFRDFGAVAEWAGRIAGELAKT